MTNSITKIISRTFALALFLSMSATALAVNYDFSYAYSGQTLYYKIVAGTSEVTVVYPNYIPNYNYSNYYYGYTAPSGVLVIPSEVTNGGNTYSVTGIGAYSFCNCSALVSVSIPSGVTVIGDHAFYNCSGLATVSIPNSVTSIGDKAFYGCSSLADVTIPSGVTSIGQETFRGCSSLISISIPSSVTSIGESAFNGCSGLTSISIPNSVTSIGTFAFAYCSSLTSVNISSSVTSIGESAFNGCSGLTSISIPNSVTSIGTSAFAYCSSLTSVSISSSITSIAYGTFWGCSSLISISIPSSVTNFDNEVFNGCSNMQAVYYSGTLQQWCSITFANAVANPLAKAHHLYIDSIEITDLVIPAGITEVKARAFYGCSGLNSIIIPEGVTSVETNAFYNCGNLQTVSIPNSVATWGNDPFGGCVIDSLHYDADATHMTKTFFASVKKLHVGDNVTSIINSAFTGITSLQYLYIGRSVVSIGTQAFKSCTGLTQIDFNAANCAYTATSFADLPFNSCSNITKVNFGNGCRTIPAAMCYQLASISEINLSDSVSTIGVRAFYGCTGLTEITLPKGLSSIGNAAFRGCTNLSTVHYNADSCLYMGSTGNHTLMNNTDASAVFYNCSMLKNITIGSNVKHFPNYGFLGLAGNVATVHYEGTIEQWCNITMPSGYANPRNYTHHLYIGNEEVVHLVIPEGITTLKPYAFYNCFSILSVQLPTTMTHIGNGAFKRCTALTEIDIPEAISAIDMLAFDSCVQLADVYVHAYTPPTIASNTFSHIKSGALLHVPCGGSSIYQNTTQWNTAFADKQEDFAYRFEAVSANPAFGSVQVLQAPACGNYQAQIEAVPYTGFQFTGWSDGVQQNPRYIVVLSDTTFTAQFVVGQQQNTPSDTLTVHDTIYIYDTVTQSYTDTATGISYVYVHDTVMFALHDTVTLTQHDTIILHGSDSVVVGNYVHDTVTLIYRDTVTLSYYYYDTAFVYNYVHDTLWLTRYVYDTADVMMSLTAYLDSVMHDDEYLDANLLEQLRAYIDESLPDTVTIVYTVTDTLTNTIYVHDTLVENIEYRNIRIVSTNQNNGVCVGTGRFPVGTVVEIAAIPTEGYRFVEWDDGNTDNPRAVTVEADGYYFATFTMSNSGVATAEAPQQWTVSVESGDIVVRGEALRDVMIVDEYGRILLHQTEAADEVRCPAPASGVYFARVGTSSARRVVVVR